LSFAPLARAFFDQGSMEKCGCI